MLDARVLFCRFRGAVAQLVERYIRIVEARGSNPLSSTTTFSGSALALTHRAERRCEALQLAHPRRLIRKVPLHNLPEANTVSSRTQVSKFVNDHRLKAGWWCHHESPRE